MYSGPVWLASRQAFAKKTSFLAVAPACFSGLWSYISRVFHDRVRFWRLAATGHKHSRAHVNVSQSIRNPNGLAT